MQTPKKTRRNPVRRNQSTNLTLPPSIRAGAKIRGEATFGSVSAYVAHLIMQDLTAHGIDVPEVPAAPLPPLKPPGNDTLLSDAGFAVKDPQIEKLRKVKKPK